jgi:hypothetical protein
VTTLFGTASPYTSKKSATPMIVAAIAGTVLYKQFQIHFAAAAVLALCHWHHNSSENKVTSPEMISPSPPDLGCNIHQNHQKSSKKLRTRTRMLRRRLQHVATQIR